MIMLALTATGACQAQAITLLNCGASYHYAAPPKRTLVYTNPATENMLALGLESAIYGVVGYQPADDTAPSPYTQNANLRVLSVTAPLSAEVVLQAQPDMVYSNSFYWFYSSETASRQQLTHWGIGTYLSDDECPGQYHHRNNNISFGSIFNELRNIGRLYAIAPRAEALITRIQQQRHLLAQQGQALRGQRMLWWYSGTKTPYVAGCCGAPDMLTREVGGQNIFADNAERWPTVSWEVIAVRDPDVLVLGDLPRGGPGDSAREKIHFLEHYPATAAMRAVRHQRYIILPGADLDPSARSVFALQRLVNAFLLLTKKTEP